MSEVTRVAKRSTNDEISIQCVLIGFLCLSSLQCFCPPAMPKISLQNRVIREKRYDDFSKNEYHEISDIMGIEEFPNKFYKLYTKD